MTRHRAVSGIAQCFLGLAILAMASQAAMADPVTLICHYKANVMSEDVPTLIDLDETQVTVVVHFSGYSAIGYSNHFAERTVGPMHATFGPQEVTFENPDPNSGPNGGHDEYVLNRLTGNMKGLWAQDEMSCQAGKKQF